MNEYIIRYKQGDETKSISIIAKTPIDAKSIFASSNKAEILACTKVVRQR